MPPDMLLDGDESMNRRRSRSPGPYIVALAILMLAPEAVLGQGRQILGGSLGSAAGFLGGIYAGAALSGDGGDIYDLAVGAVVGSGVGAATGAWLLTRLGDEEEVSASFPAAFLGGVVGTVVAIGVAQYLDDELRGDPSGAIWLGFTVTQGTITGLGAWLGGRRQPPPR